MAKFFRVLWSLLFFIWIHLVSVLISGPRQWWPPHGIMKIKCPHKKMNLCWFSQRPDPRPDLKQPISGNNFVTYDNPCVLCLESLKSHGRIVSP
ncbi:serine protease inhibitor Kazal-type 14 [Marmota monax]|uniref:serine protease inhibitor Kazal-type 14 n=1 Tax=Marmota monax TaxID=9995 RepID=UPI001EAFEF45|nr:serine protease inhibitor Kazal-type 14 [Marmota monax]